eukprot:gene15322-21406_t
MMKPLVRSAMRGCRTAITSEGSNYSYKSILDCSEALASQISKVPGFRAGSLPRIGLYAQPGVEYVAGTLAIWQAGGIAVPLATSHPPAELSYVFQDAGLSAVLAPTSALNKFKDLSVQHKSALLHIQPPDATAANASEPASTSATPTPLTGSDQGSLIIYTSGTTGKPKGASGCTLMMYTSGTTGVGNPR